MSIYIAIDLKSFYASVECVERGFNPLTTNLVVADSCRTEKTICLAVSPSLKAYGISGRARLYEVVQKVKEVNANRIKKARNMEFVGKSYDDTVVQKNPNIALDYYIAPPRMAYYMNYSSRIYQIYLKYVSKEDIHVYSIDEVFIDVTSYLQTYQMTAHQLAMSIIHDILDTTGITATCGIGTNLYLAKIAMDVVAKHIPADKDGVRIAQLDEISYRKKLWEHRPLTDFWRIGKGIAKKLEENGIYTQGDIARVSIDNEEILYKLFGINAELIIDHAWGYEPTRIIDIKEYRPDTKSISSGQVLKEPYSFEKAKLVLKEMCDALALDLVEKKVMCDQIVLTVGYDISSLEDYDGKTQLDPYGRTIPKMAHSSIHLGIYSSASSLIRKKTLELYDQIVNHHLKIRRMIIAANHIKYEEDLDFTNENKQISLFDDISEFDKKHEEEKNQLKKEKKVQEAMIRIRNKYGKNSIIKANSLQDGATAIERNESIGGHKA